MNRSVGKPRRYATFISTPIRTFHSRTIIGPDVALKVSGKRGRTNFGALLASDNAPGNFSEDQRNDPAELPAIAGFIDHNAYAGVLRVKRDVGEQSSVGIIARISASLRARTPMSGPPTRVTIPNRNRGIN
ncbi:MAG TPA: hypothetical protein VKG02_20505 [Blastocatellia bacterium]|nr:hypothetical protein [Blastocatellia bacterium]